MGSRNDQLGRLTQRIVLDSYDRRWRCAPINSDDTAAGVAAVTFTDVVLVQACSTHDAPGTLANGADQKVVHVKTQVVVKIGKLSLPYTQ